MSLNHQVVRAILAREIQSHMKSIKLLFSLMLLSVMVMAQSVGINDTGKKPNKKAILDVDISTNNKGVLLPRVTTKQREKIRGLKKKHKGLLLYDVTTQSFWYWNSEEWTEIQNGIESSSHCLSVLEFGAKGDGQTDDSEAIQAAVDSAFQIGAKVCLPTGRYAVSKTIVIPDGVIIEGEGKGATATQTPKKGSILMNTGEMMTVQIIGHNAGLRDLVVYDDNNEGSVGGVEILGKSYLVESVVLENILISGFTSGVGLTLKAEQSGGVTYNSFYDVRIRHAKTGVLITEDETSFVNSNAFYHGAISGGGFDYCLHVKGGNNNVFQGTIIEPYTSEFGHVVVEAGSIIGDEIRIEGVQQPANTPLVHFYPGANESRLTGLYSGGMTIDLGDNFLDLRSGKFMDPFNAGTNLLTNAAFKGVTNNSIPYWDLSGSGITVVSQSAQVINGQNVIELTVPAGASGYLKPSALYTPSVLETARYDRVNFAAMVKVSAPNVVQTSVNSNSGISSSSFHPGDGNWHSVGMTGNVNRTQPLSTKWLITNSTGGEIKIYITAPTLSFGNHAAQLEAAPLSTAGGVLTGTFTLGMMEIETPSNGRLILPRDGNIFEITNNVFIQRINDSTADRFPKGTVITLLFNQSGTSVASTGYIVLKGAYTSTANSSLTIVSNGNGTWREINRNL